MWPDSLACLPLHALDLEKEVDPNIPVFFTSPSKACVINPTAQRLYERSG